jgi:hypothetical protein
MEATDLQATGEETEVRVEWQYNSNEEVEVDTTGSL